MSQRKSHTQKPPAARSRGSVPPREQHQRRSPARDGSSRRLVTISIVAAGLLIAGFVIVASFSGGSWSSSPTTASGTTGQADAAVTTLQERLKQNPSDTTSMLALGNALYDQSRWSEAIPWYEKYLQSSPGNNDVQTDLGTAYLYSGNGEKAKEIWTKVLQSEPNKVETHYNLAIYYTHKSPSDMDAAVKEWETVISVAPNSSQGQSALKQLQALGKR